MSNDTTGFTPDEINQLNNAPSALSPEDQAALSAAPVGDRPIADVAAGYGKSVIGGINEGAARTLGSPVDLYNMIGDVTAGRGLAWLLNKFGASGAADWIRQHGYQDIYTGSGQSVVDALRPTDTAKIGIGYDPQTPGEAMTRKAVAGTTQGALTGALTGGAGALTDAPTAISTGAISGAGSVAGGEAAKGINDLSSRTLGVSIDPDTAELLGSLLGGFGSPAIASVASREATPLQQLMESKGVTPRFPSDVDPNAGLGLVANRFGAQGVTRGHLSDMQAALSNYAQRFLRQPDGDVPTLGQTTQRLGQTIQSTAEQGVADLRGEISNAFDELGQVVPDDTTVDLSSTHAAIDHVASRSTDPDVQAALKKAATDDPVLATLLQKDQLTWGDMNDVRTRIGQLLQSADGQTLGALKQVYGGIMDDMRDAAMEADPKGLELFEHAYQTATTNNEKIRGVLETLSNRESPETLPAYMLGQSKAGGTRLESLFGSMPSTAELNPALGYGTSHTWSSDNLPGAPDPRFGPARPGSMFGATPTGNKNPVFGDIEVKLTNQDDEPVSLTGQNDQPLGPKYFDPTVRDGLRPGNDNLLDNILNRIRNLDGLHYVDPAELRRTPDSEAPVTSFRDENGHMQSNSAQGDIGRQLLINAGNKAGSFDLDQLMKFWNSASPEARAALTQTPYIADNMGALEQMYNATQRSQKLAGQAGDATAISDPITAATGLVTAGSGIVHGLSGGNPVAAAGLMATAGAEPVAANLIARTAQTPTGVRLATGTPTIPMNLKANAAGTGIGMGVQFPPTYTPPAQPQAAAEPPSGADAQAWLNSVPRTTALAYIGNRLGAQAVQQIQAAGDQGYNAAIFNLWANPQYRKQLTTGPSTAGNVIGAAPT